MHVAEDKPCAIIHAYHTIRICISILHTCIMYVHIVHELVIGGYQELFINHYPIVTIRILYGGWSYTVI